ncbi:hypothetical protein [Halorussus pelagicus]|uniref:hypothetical protein n=1 Tax=Halorussus pelagicus TaxID=2505977 RepID=UPI000FFBC048|nr:hypothetical protein [Halorussus pelagicus]
MIGERNVSRRSFVKKSVVATGLTGGVLGSTQSVAADSPQTLFIEGQGDYIAVVNDPNATGRNLESGDSIRSDDDKTIVEGSVNGDVDKIDFDGWVTTLNLDGNLDAIVDGTDDAPNGDLVVEGSNSSYAFIVGYSAEKTSDCESTESVSNDANVAGKLDFSDTDTFSVIGALEDASTFSSDANVTFRYKD